MNKLLHHSLKKLLLYAGLVLVISIPAYYFIISRLWQYEMDEHDIVLTDKAIREDSMLIITTVTGLTVIFFILLMAGFLWLNRRISRRLWQPFYQTLDQIRLFDLKNQQKPRFEPTRIEEFDELQRGLGKLLAGNITAYRLQKEFADNASHELQTPLAIIQSKLDLLLQSQSLTSEQYDIIEDANKALARVTRINKNLLLLARIGNSQFMETATFNLSDLLQQSVKQFEPFASSGELITELNITPDVRIDGNQTLLEILLHNLLTNAIRYTPPGGRLTISLDPGQLTIANSDATPLDPDQLFRRFATVATSNHPLPAGTGLGLSIVQQIAQRYHWSIIYTYTNQQHTFSLRF